MVKTEELKIGSWLIDLNGKYQNVGSLQDNFYGVLINKKSEYDFNPIPITPELLEICSISQECFHDGLRIYNFGCFFGYCQGKYLWIAEGLNHGKKYDHIKHIHQLQNLYHGLTGRELEIDL